MPKEEFKRIPVVSLLTDSHEGCAVPAGASGTRSSSEEKDGASERDSKDAERGSSSSFRPRWSKKEDDRLTELVAELGPRNWNQIAQHFEGRNGRQVRLRWMNHLSPDVEDREWTAEEDRIILDAQQRHGNKWTLIAKLLRGRSDNATKNRFNRLQRLMRTQAVGRTSRTEGREVGPSVHSSGETVCKQGGCHFCMHFSRQCVKDQPLPILAEISFQANRGADLGRVAGRGWSYLFANESQTSREVRKELVLGWAMRLS